MIEQSSMVDVLTTLWQRVLQRVPVRAADNFFDLGGDAQLARVLFGEIAREQGRDLAPETIYLAPTITTLAALLGAPSEPRIPSLLLLKPGVEGPPVFIAHGLGDTVMNFSQLLGDLQCPHPIYGMQARGPDGLDEPFDRIEDIAQFHLEAIKGIQPYGPYFLVGYSLGGLVTFEIAQRLSHNGDKIALLAMLDSYPGIQHLPIGQRALLNVRLARRRAAGAIESLGHKTRSQTYSARTGTTEQTISAKRALILQRMAEADARALKRYRPRVYRGKITFVKASVNSSFPGNPAAVWSHLASAVAVETTPGDHLQMLTTYSADLASRVSRYLREASLGIS